MNASSDAQRYVVAAIAIAVLAIALRTAGIARETPWHDEVLSLRYIDAPTLSEYMDRITSNDPAIKPFPLYFAAQYGWARIVGRTEMSLRLLSVACSIAAILALMETARRLFDARTAIAAGALFAVSLPHIYFAQEIRIYALVTLLAACSCYCFVRLLLDGGQRWFWLNAAANALMPWTHVYAPLIWLAQGGTLLVALHPAFRTRSRAPSMRLALQWIGIHLAIAAVFAVWIWRIGYVVEDEYVKQATPSFRELLNAFNVYAGGRFSKLNPAMYLRTGFSLDRAITLTLAAACAVVIFRSFRRNDSDREKLAITFCALCVFAPPLFLFLVSQVWKPLFVFRYTLYSTLGLYPIAGRAFGSSRTRPALNAAALIVVILYTHQLTVLAQPFRPDYREADAFVRSRSGGETNVYVLKRLNGIPYRYHSALPPNRIEVHEGLGELLAAVEQRVVKERGEAWIVLWQWDDFETIESFFEARGAHTERHTFSGIPPLYVYQVNTTPARTLAALRMLNDRLHERFGRRQRSHNLGA